ncbi:MAG TPA: putative quinol monooxygenase [Baekduia sp.]|nr:putative quinol monooxygenase [Baekduia sp.]
MLLITFEAKVTDADREAVLAMAQLAMSPTRAEPGCISYDVLVDVEDPNRILWVEQWRDARAFETHQRAPHIQQFLDEATPLIADTQLVIHTISASQEVTLPG